MKLPAKRVVTAIQRLVSTRKSVLSGLANCIALRRLEPTVARTTDVY